MALLFAVLLLFLLCGSPARAEWQVAESAHFRLFQKGDAEPAAEQVRQLEELHALLASLTGAGGEARARPRLDLFIVEDLSEALPGVALSPGIRGFYRTTPGGIAVFARADSTGRGAGSQHVLFHEVTHHFLGADWAHAYPAWYVEGLAEYFGTARFLPRRIDYGRVDQARLAWLLKGPWLPPEDVLRWRGESRDPARTSMLYAQSWLLTHWLLRTPGGPERLSAYLSALTRGEDPVLAFAQHVDPDLDTLNSRLAAYFSDPRWANFTRVRRERPLEVDVSVTALPPSAERLLLPKVVIQQGIDQATGGKLLEAIRAGADANDPWAMRALALAELRHGDAGAALAMLETMLQRAPGDAELLRWRGEARLKISGNLEAARGDFRAAFAAEPGDWRAMVAYVRTYPPNALDPETLAVLERGWTLAPQVKETAVMLAQALALKGRNQEAARLVQPIIFGPHGVFLPPRATWLALPLQAR
ncbi:hypothetical protein [Thermaurantiacus sp.]